MVRSGLLTIGKSLESSVTILSKTIRVIDKKYIEWIRSLNCIVCGYGLCDPHHVNKEGHGGMGTKTSDDRTIPLCHKHHQEVHQIGRKTFAKKHGIDYEHIIERLNNVYENLYSL